MYMIKTNEMVQGKKRERKKPNSLQGEIRKTQMNTLKEQKVKNPHPGRGKEGGYGGSKGQRCPARRRQRAVGRDDGWVLVGEAPGADPGDAQFWQWCQQLRSSYRLRLRSPIRQEDICGATLGAWNKRWNLPPRSKGSSLSSRENRISNMVVAVNSVRIATAPNDHRKGRQLNGTQDMAPYHQTSMSPSQYCRQKRDSRSCMWRPTAGEGTTLSQSPACTMEVERARVWEPKSGAEARGVWRDALSMVLERQC